MSFTNGPVRPLTLVSALLLTTALAAPAYAEIEEVVVTAQKQSQDVQTVPIAISAFTAQDLTAHQISRFNDLQFSTPSVSYSKGNFTGSDFQIRGIGVTAVGYDSESGVAVNFNDVFLANPPLADGSFYDLERIEVLRGPQSTLYGRGATGGVVNVQAAKPELDAFSTNLEATYGNYNYTELKGYVNIPLDTDHLAARISGDFIRHSGFTTNLFDNSHPDDRNQYSVRGELRWQPTVNTTVDFTAQSSKEDDHKMRSQKSLCDQDPTGVLGCLPTGATPGGFANSNATSASEIASKQAMLGAFGAAPPFGIGPAAAGLGLTDLSVAPVLTPGAQSPADPRQIYTTYDPAYKAQDNFMALNWRQSWTPWLDSTAVIGYDNNSIVSQESFTNAPANPINPVAFATAKATLLGTLTALGGPAYAAKYASYFATANQLPQSTFQNLGLTSGNYTLTNQLGALDQSDGRSTQWSGELRFNTKFQGPLNAMLAVYYLQEHSGGDYYVQTPAYDYAGIVVGAIKGLASAPALCAATGCILAPTFYHNDGELNRLSSKAIYGEVYYDAIPDLVKLTLGLRYTEDDKVQQGRIALISGLVPIGTSNEDAALAALVAQGQTTFDASQATPQVWQYNNVKYSKLTGRAVVDYTPKLDFTDATLIYGSYARGYKAGGFNPGIQTGQNVQANYNPESIDAYELGTKNTILGGTMQVNGDVWYYNYTGLQVSQIVNNTSVNQNINATLYGVEGTMIWAPDDHWQFNLGLSNTNSDIGNSSSVDTRNPTNGYAKALLIKDATLGSNVGKNCVLYYNGAAPGSLPAGLGFFAPPGGVGGLAGAGIPYAAFGTCLDPNTVVAPGVTYGQALALQGFSTAAAAVNGKYDGVPVSLKGNQLQNTPDVTISVGGQYTFSLDGGYHLIARADYYWQDSMFGRIFNGPADRIASWDMTNLSVQLNAPDSVWYVRGFVKNVMDNKNLTGEYLASPTVGLYTNGFYTDPRTYGLVVGVNF